MGLTKRIFIDKDPAYETVRRNVAEEASAYRKQFPCRIALNRKNALGNRPHWDPIWHYAVPQAASELKLDTVSINSGLFLRTDGDRKAVIALAETIWREQVERHSPRRPSR